ncbi:MAG: thioredoxin family protein [Zoogloeaceae bacterium]|jgi:peroxiredoxin|nr:thioredoxin family protein [Zoogloeaceae bacterium]
MAALSPPVCDFGWVAPDFSLPDTNARVHTRASLAGEKGLLIMFLCNHCPYVQAILPRLAAECRVLRDLGIGVAAIMSNDVEAYPEDAPARMKALAEKLAFSFPYLYDREQSVARAYGAVCTPDFFGFDAALSLRYRGRFDGSGMGQSANSGAESDLLMAMRAIAETGEGPAEQRASIGCSIKWKSA